MGYFAEQGPAIAYRQGMIPFYRPRSWELSTAELGDNVLGSVRPSVRPFVRLCALSWLNRLTFDLDFLCEGRP